MNNTKLKIGILGLGLIGGSILKALSPLNKYELYIFSHSSSNKALEYTNQVSSDDLKILSLSDIVFVCSKMNLTLDYLDKLGGVVSKSCIVSDVCSVKGFLKEDYNYNFISSHPMAGTEFFGFENSFKELFYGAKWIIEKKNPLLEAVIKDTGAKPVIFDKISQDKMTSDISHFPMLLSMALFNSVDDKSKKIASSGFRDTTRLSMTNPDLAYDMLKYNRENILTSYLKFKESFEKLINLKEDDFKNVVLEINTKRQNMYDKNGKNKIC